MTSANKREQIKKSLEDKEYRHQFVEEEINVGIAFQIRALRNRQDLTQDKLAELMGGKQSLLSSWENPNYGKFTLKTLKDLAKAFDVGLLVRFVPFSTLVDWTVNQTKDSIAPPNYNEERTQFRLSATTTTNAVQGLNANSNMADFVNGLVPGTFQCPTAAINQKEPTHA